VTKWIRVSDDFKRLIRLRRKALHSGNYTSFKFYRNRINRARKLCRAKFYASDVKQLKKSNPKNWWREVKRISGMVSSSGPTNLVSQLQTIIPNNPTPLDLANLVNSSFLRPTMNYNPLDSDTLHDLFSGITHETSNFETIERSDITTPLSVYNKLNL
jgi:hypothetical protein